MDDTIQWHEIRAGLRSTNEADLRQSVVRVGKIKTETLPTDVGEAMIGLFKHSDPSIRAEAVRAVGLHWRLESAVIPTLDLLENDQDWQVQISSISALGALALDHAPSRSVVCKGLAQVALNDRFADNERMLAYLELLRIEGRITAREYLVRDKELPDRLSEFEMDQAWVKEIVQRECPAQ